jgi:enhancing lycopene biosynthesis protein 2
MDTGLLSVPVPSWSIVSLVLVPSAAFTVGNTSTNADADVIDLKDLLTGYGSTSNLSDFVTSSKKQIFKYY